MFNLGSLVSSITSACMQLLCGLLGIPPLNGVLPQAPMHTKSLVTLKQMLVGRNAVRKSKLHQAGLDSKTKSAIDLASLDAVPVNTRKSHADLQVRILPVCADHLSRCTVMTSVGLSYPAIPEAAGFSCGAISRFIE